MNHIKKAAFIPVFMLICFSAIAQLDKYTTVEISLSQPNLNSVDFPFDIGFFMTGEVAEDCFKMDFEYKLKDDEKKRDKSWITFPPVNVKAVPPAINRPFFKCDPWVRSNAKENKFLLFCPGLHPNLHYEFKFTLYKSVGGDDASKTDLKDKIAAKQKEFFSVNANSAIDTTMLKNHLNELTDLVKTNLGVNGSSKLLKEKSNPKEDFVVKLKSLGGVTDAIQDYAGQIASAETKLKKEDKFIEEFKKEFTAQRTSTLQQIDNILKDEISLNKYSKEILDLKFNPGLADFKDYSLLDGLKTLRALCLVPNNAERIIEGKMKIENNGVVDVLQPHFESIYFLESLLSTLADGYVQKVESGANKPLFANLVKLKKRVTEVAKEYRHIETAQIALATISKDLPELTAGVIILQSVTADVIPFPDVVTENTPYISADGGLGYAADFQAGFNYFGANFYLSPINKKAPLSNFRGWNLIKKMLCINMGIANFFGDRPSTTQSILGKTSQSDFMVGLGLRLGRVLKINFGAIPYKTNNEKPLTDEYKVKFAFYGNAGIDVNILKAFNQVAKVLKLVD